jgi:hypothetical protein
LKSFAYNNYRQEDFKRFSDIMRTINRARVDIALASVSLKQFFDNIYEIQRISI